jgi:integrase
MVCTFARVGAVIKMRSEDVYLQGRRTWVRLHEKGGKRYEMPCHHLLDVYLREYIEAAGVADERKGWLFRSTRAPPGCMTGATIRCRWMRWSGY